MGALAIVGIVVILGAVFAALSVKVVQAHEKLVIFRLGRGSPDLVRNPGVAFLLPVLDRAVRVDMRPRVYEIVDARMPTDDGKAIAADATIRCHVLDAYAATINVASLDGALPGVTETTLRSIAVEMRQSELLVGRARLDHLVLEKITAVGSRWGVAIDGFEITDVRPLDSVR